MAETDKERQAAIEYFGYDYWKDPDVMTCTVDPQAEKVVAKVWNEMYEKISEAEAEIKLTNTTISFYNGDEPLKLSDYSGCLTVNAAAYSLLGGVVGSPVYQDPYYDGTQVTRAEKRIKELEAEVLSLKESRKEQTQKRLAAETKVSDLAVCYESKIARMQKEYDKLEIVAIQLSALLEKHVTPLPTTEEKRAPLFAAINKVHNGPGAPLHSIIENCEK